MIAAIDCGTNSVRLLIAQENSDGTLSDIVRKMIIVRLGEGVDKTGEFSPQALMRTFNAIEEYAQDLHDHHVDKVRFIATSASRDVSNHNEFFQGVKSRLGVIPEVISGDEEASLSFRGATQCLDDKLQRPILLVDIGGGSTEFVTGHESILASISTNMGSVRVYERFFSSIDMSEGEGSLDPVIGGQGVRKALIEASAFVDSKIDEAMRSVDFFEAQTLVGVAGTVTTLAAHALGLDSYQPDVIHGSAIKGTDYVTSCYAMMSMNVAGRDALGYMPQGRADVIGAGALIWSRIIERFMRCHPDKEDLSIITSDHDILDGVALSLLDS
ncbi:MAG: exopolyphosphatase [Actinomycetaceae bacterium]|nr:exopolyphosphatase [Actinomycetaceae bacterium]